MNEHKENTHKRLSRELANVEQLIEQGEMKQVADLLKQTKLTVYDGWTPHQQGVLHWILGMLHDQQGDWQKAKRELTKSIDCLHVPLEPALLVRSMIALSKVTGKLDNSARALTLLQNAYRIAVYERIPTHLEILLLFQLGITHGELGEFHSSIYFLNLALRHNQAIQAHYYQGQLHMSLGVCYMQLDQFVESKNAFEQATHAFTLDQDDENLAGTYLNLGILYTYHHQYEEAAQYLKQASEMYHFQGEMQAKHNCLIKLAQAYYHDDEIDTAATYCKGILVEKNLEAHIAMKTHELLSEIAETRQDLSAALEYLTQATRFASSATRSRDYERLQFKQVKLYFAAGKPELASRVFTEMD